MKLKLALHSVWQFAVERKALFLLPAIAALLVGMPSLHAQGMYIGTPTYVAADGIMTIAEDTVVLDHDDIITYRGDIAATNRAGSGVILFKENVGWKNPFKKFIDGWAGTERTGDFVYPVGQDDEFRPFKISAATQIVADVAFYKDSVNILTEYPKDATKSVDIGRNARILAGTWIVKPISGTTTATITLSWVGYDIVDEAAEYIATEDMYQSYFVAGWNQATEKWEYIPSAFNQTASIAHRVPTPEFNPGTVVGDSGSISTVDAVDFINDYKVFAIGVRNYQFNVTLKLNGMVNGVETAEFENGSKVDSVFPVVAEDHPATNIIATRQGYDFGGWSNGMGDTINPLTNLTVTQDTVLYAVWGCTTPATPKLKATYNSLTAICAPVTIQYFKEMFDLPAGSTDSIRIYNGLNGAEIVGGPNTLLDPSIDYYVTRVNTAGGCESSRVPITRADNVQISIETVTPPVLNPIYTTSNPVIVCWNMTVADLKNIFTQEADHRINIYTSETAVTALPDNTPLVTGQVYWTSRTKISTGCESERITVKDETGIDFTIDEVTPPVLSPIYNAGTNPAFICWDETISTLINMLVQETGYTIRIYTSQNAAIQDSIPAATALVAGQIYWASRFNADGCQSVRVRVVNERDEVLTPTKPDTPELAYGYTNTNPPYFCWDATITEIKAFFRTDEYDWTINIYYDNNPASLPLTNTHVLELNHLYYVSQTNNRGCESERLPFSHAKYNIGQPIKPDAPLLRTTYTATSPLIICWDMTITEVRNAFTTQPAGGTINIYLNDQTTLVDNTDALIPGHTYYVSQTNAAGCESDRISFADYQNRIETPNKPGAPVLNPLYGVDNPAYVCWNLTITQIKNVFSGNVSIYYNQTDILPVADNTSIVPNHVYWVSQTVDGCESERYPFSDYSATLQILDKPEPPQLKVQYDAMEFICAGSTVNDIKYFFDYDPANEDIHIYNVSGTEMIGQLVAGENYWVSKTVNGCESDRIRMVNNLNQNITIQDCDLPFLFVCEDRTLLEQITYYAPWQIEKIEIEATAGGSLDFEDYYVASNPGLVQRNLTIAGDYGKYARLTLIGGDTDEIELRVKNCSFFVWNYLSSPYVQSTPEAFNVPQKGPERELGYNIAPKAFGSYLGYYDEVTKTYQDQPFKLNTPEAETPFTPGRGFVASIDTMLWNPPTMDDFNKDQDWNTMNYTVNTGNIAVMLDSTPHNHRHWPKAGKNLVGNPYDRYINFDLVYRDNAANIGSSYWIRGYNRQNGRMLYDAYNAAIGWYGTGLINGERLNGNIPPIQGFWVQARKDNVSMQFSETHRTANDPSQPLRAPALSPNKGMALKLHSVIQSGKKSDDETIIVFAPIATNDWDICDTEKMTHGDSIVPEIYTKLGLREIVINSMTAIDREVIIPLGFRTEKAGNFTLSGDFSRWDDSRVYLYDNETKISTELAAGKAYNFSTTGAVDNLTRFSIIVESAAPNATQGTEAGNYVKIYVNDDNRIVVQTDIPDAPCTVYSTTGQKIAEDVITSGMKVLDVILEAGVYVVKVDNTTEKVIIK